MWGLYLEQFDKHYEAVEKNDQKETNELKVLFKSLVNVHKPNNNLITGHPSSTMSVNK